MSPRGRALLIGSIAFAVVGALGAAYTWIEGRDRGTAFAAHTKVRIQSGENLVYCATLQLAWDSLADAVGRRELDLGPPAPPDDVAELNRRSFPRDALAPGSFVALGGLGRDGIGDRIRQALQGAFAEHAPKVEIAAGPMEAVGFAYLRRDLPFVVPFTKLERPIRFRRGFLPWMQGREVAAFGVLSSNPGGELNGKYYSIDAQVTVLEENGDRAAPNEFVVEVSLKDTTERLLLARIDPGATLEETWRDAERRIATGHPHVLAQRDYRRFAVPMIRLDRTQGFPQFVGAPLRGVPGSAVQEIMQHVLFRLDETGTLLESDARTRMKGGHGREPPRPDYVFDRPFLVALMRRGATRPYFLLWIGNEDLFLGSQEATRPS